MRPLALVLFLAASAVTVGCGPTVKCGPGNCSGCCDASGMCQSGAANTACGTGGLICNACFAGQTCSLGLCNSAGSGGGNGSGGGFGGGTGGGAGGGSGGGGTGGGFGGGSGGGFGGGSGGGSGGGFGGGSGGGSGGGFGGGTGGGGAASAWETWCRTTYMPAFCDAGIRCGLYANRTICEQVFSTYLVCASTPAHRDGRTVLDTTAANACVNQLSGSCDSPDLALCLATRGTGTLNAPCYGSGECEANLYCALNTCPGTCQPRTPNGSAPAPGGECAQGSYVYGTTCQPYVPVGQSCAPVSPETGARQCVSTAFCGSGGLCIARRTAGQTCEAGQCAGFLTCWGGVCAAPGNLGDPCDSTRSCRSGYRCGNTNVCVAAGTVGSPCTSLFADCEPQLICDIPFGQAQGTCSPVHTIGQSCTFSGYQCGLVGQLYCTATSASPTGICAMKKGIGANCSSYAECSTSVCSSSNVCAGCLDPTP